MLFNCYAYICYVQCKSIFFFLLVIMKGAMVQQFGGEERCHTLDPNPDGLDPMMMTSFILFRTAGLLICGIAIFTGMSKGSIFCR